MPQLVPVDPVQPSGPIRDMGLVIILRRFALCLAICTIVLRAMVADGYMVTADFSDDAKSLVKIEFCGGGDHHKEERWLDPFTGTVFTEVENSSEDPPEDSKDRKDEKAGPDCPFASLTSIALPELSPDFSASLYQWMIGDRVIPYGELGGISPWVPLGARGPPLIT